MILSASIIHECIHVVAPVLLGFLAGFFGSYKIMASQCPTWVKTIMILVLMVIILFGSEFLHDLRVDVTRYYRTSTFFCDNMQSPQ